MPAAWRCCCATGLCRGYGFRPLNSATSGKCCVGACAWWSRAARSRTAFRVLLRYNVTVTATDLYGAAGRAELQQRWTELPEWTRQSVQEQLETIHHLDQQIEECEQKLESLLEN